MAIAGMFRNDLLKGKRILVTGGGTGLGKEMSEGYLKLGAEVIIIGRRKGVLDETAKELMDKHGGKVQAIACDIRVADAVKEMVDEAFAGGALTGLVNNAAGNFISPTKDLSPRGFDAIANIVFHGSFYVTHAVGTRWIANKQKGNVISILTTWVWNGGPFTVPSAMSKAALNIMTKSLAVEWAPYGIRLNAIAPGPFPTKGAWERLSPGQAVDGSQSQSRSVNPMGRVGQMEELCNLAVFMMADGADYMTGETVAIDGGMYLGGGGNFSALSQVSDTQWAQWKDMIRAANERDKAQRSV